MELTAKKQRHLYLCWWNMFDRCSNPANKDFVNHGGRGIRVCVRWHIFALFVEDMGPRPAEGMSIDRIDNEKGYEPQNCRWATPAQQVRNQRKKNIDAVYKMCKHSNMAQETPQNTDGQGRSTKTLSVRLPLAQALAIEKQAQEKGYKNVNQYLVAMVGLIATLTPSNPIE